MCQRYGGVTWRCGHQTPSRTSTCRKAQLAGRRCAEADTRTENEYLPDDRLCWGEYGPGSPPGCLGRWRDGLAGEWRAEKARACARAGQAGKPSVAQWARAWEQARGRLWDQLAVPHAYNFFEVAQRCLAARMRTHAASRWPQLPVVDDVVRAANLEAMETIIIDLRRQHRALLEKYNLSQELEYLVQATGILADANRLTEQREAY